MQKRVEVAPSRERVSYPLGCKLYPPDRLHDIQVLLVVRYFCFRIVHFLCFSLFTSLLAQFAAQPSTLSLPDLHASGSKVDSGFQSGSQPLSRLMNALPVCRLKLLSPSPHNPIPRSPPASGCPEATGSNPLRLQQASPP
mmetsp:Transcript_13504/g.31093  ORF Transcript_13504/g.31093 Transcript_13504/m.31093 type:complete len:140 (-) Transcript_13504:170-589(-)|eukprot:759510-Hanusia_phi.AAC.5